MTKKGKLKAETRDSEKAIIIEFRDKETKNRTLGFVQEIISNGKILLDVRPIVYKATFEGDNVKLGLPVDPKRFMDMIMKFESSEHEVLVISGKRASGFSKKQFDRILESMLHKMVTKKYLQELHKKPKEGYVI